MANAAEMMAVTTAWRMHMPETTKAVRYVGAPGVAETGDTGSVGEVALGK